MNLGYSENDKTLCHIGFGRQMNEVKLNGINLFLDPPEDVLEKLKKLDAEPYIYMGFIVFMNIGLTLTGFHDENISQKAAALFPKGAWDKRLGKMKRFRD